MTFDAIYDRMAAAYAAQAGYRPEDASDAGIRLKVLAGEIYAALCSLRTVEAEAFPQTTSGAALDLHAGERGLSRKPAVQATGAPLFFRETPLEYDIEIPAGTVCAASGAAAEYETTAAGVIPAGAYSVEVPARAVLGGRKYNAAAKRIDTLVTPPVGVEYVMNMAPFSGGTDAESDDALRLRLLHSCGILPNGANSETYRRAALEVPGIGHANVVPRENGIGTVSVYVYGDGADATEEMVAQVKAHLDALREINVDVTVQQAAAVHRDLAVYIQPKANCAFGQAQALCEAALLEVFSRLTVGDSFVLASCTAALMQTGAIENCTWTVGTKDYLAAADEIVLPGTISILEAS